MHIRITTTDSFEFFLDNQVKLKKKKYLTILWLFVGYFLINAVRIYSYSFNYSEHKSDSAIVLGAGTHNGSLSPVFRERINHSILLYDKGIVNKIILTGGFGTDQKQSDSQTAKFYVLKNGIPESDVIIEEISKYTSENLEQSKNIMDSLGIKNALIISDPMHMKRSMTLALGYNIDCQPSPTKTSMYSSTYTQTKQLLYETFYFTLREPLSLFSI